MLENQFEAFLLDDVNIESKEKAVASRVSKARAIERELDKSLDEIVGDDRSMYNALVIIKGRMNDKSGAYSNALRKYYIFKNGREFPRLSAYERRDCVK